MTHYSNTSNPVDFPKLSAVDRLWGEALDRAVPDTYSSLTWTQVERIKTVFAELIVMECIGILETEIELVEGYKSTAHNDFDIRWHDGKIVHFTKLIEKSKEHFGVEE